MLIIPFGLDLFSESSFTYMPLRPSAENFCYKSTKGLLSFLPSVTIALQRQGEINLFPNTLFHRN